MNRGQIEALLINLKTSFHYICFRYLILTRSRIIYTTVILNPHHYNEF